MNREQRRKAAKEARKIVRESYDCRQIRIYKTAPEWISLEEFKAIKKKAFWAEN